MCPDPDRHDLGIPFLSKSCKGDERGGHGGRREGTRCTPALEVVLVVDVIFGREDARLALLRKFQNVLFILIVLWATYGQGASCQK